MSKSLIAVYGFGFLLAYSLFLIFTGGNPGGVLFVAIAGFLVSLGNYLSS